MIIKAEHINAPISGMYKEKIYDIQSPWNSQNWTWLRFTNAEYDEWCGEFRGDYRGHGVSQKYNSIYILTSDYFYQLNIDDGEILRFIDRPEYNSLTVSPEGECFAASYYDIFKINNSIESVTHIQSPKQLDMIMFSSWEENILSVSAEEFANWNNRIEMKLDSVSLICKVVKESK